MSELTKVTDEHRRRRAVVYVTLSVAVEQERVGLAQLPLA